MNVTPLAITLLQREEGLRLEPYQCTVGKWTCWHGRNFQDHPLSVEETSQLIRQGSTPEFAEWLLGREVTLLDGILGLEPWYSRQDDVRKAILLSMAYQLGYRGLIKFTHAIYALNRQDYSMAYTELMDSRWARQTPERAQRAAKAILTGEMPA